MYEKFPKKDVPNLFKWVNLGAFLILVRIKVDGTDLMELTKNYYDNGVELE